MFKKGLFRKKEKGLDKKTKMKKSTIIIIDVAVVVLLAAIALGIKFLVTNKIDKNVVKLENQVVNNVTFTDFNLKYKNKKSNIKVTMINYTAEEIIIKKLTIKLYASDNRQVSEITVDYLENADEPLKLGENQQSTFENSTKLDLTDITKVEYIIE